MGGAVAKPLENRSDCGYNRVVLRIGVVSDQPYEASARVRRITRALAARGDKISLWTPRASDLPMPPVDHGVEVHRVGVGLRGRTRAAELICGLGLARAHALRRFDLVLVIGGASLSLAGLLPRLAGAPLIVDLGVETVRAFFAGPQVGLGRAAASLSLSAADAILVQTQGQYQQLIDAGIPARKLAVIPNGVSAVRYAPRKKPPRVKPGVPMRVFMCLRDPAWHTAAEALRRAQAALPELSLTLAAPTEVAFSSPGVELERIPAEVESEVFSGLLRRAHLAILSPPTDPLVAWPQLLATMSLGVTTLVMGEDPLGSPAETIPEGDVDALAARLPTILADAKGMKTQGLVNQSWSQRQGWELSERILNALVDHHCADKLRADKVAAQAAIDGTKTGRRSTPARR